MHSLVWVRVLALVLCLIVPSIAKAQVDPKITLQGLIQQLSTGTPNPTWYSPQLWAAIAAQTGGTGYYYQLAAAGPPGTITVSEQMVMPQGVLYKMRSKHSSGLTVEWLLGLNTFTNRIEYLNSNPVSGVTTAPGPFPDPDPVGKPKPNPDDDKTTIPPKDDACTKFPGLC